MRTMKSNNLETTLDTITKLSLDEENHESLCNSEKKIINFDKICNSYAKENRLLVIPTSNDGLWIEDGKFTFIEFKNGKLNNEWHHLLQKNYDSLLILFDLNLEEKLPDCKMNLSYSRKNIDYILVYNGEKNPRKDIHEKVFKLSKETSPRLAHLEGYLFRKVSILTAEEFMKEIEPLI